MIISSLISLNWPACDRTHAEISLLSLACLQALTRSTLKNWRAWGISWRTRSAGTPRCRLASEPFRTEAEGSAAPKTVVRDDGFCGSHTRAPSSVRIHCFNRRQSELHRRSDFLHEHLCGRGPRWQPLSALRTRAEAEGESRICAIYCSFTLIAILEAVYGAEMSCFGSQVLELQDCVSRLQDQLSQAQESDLSPRERTDKDAAARNAWKQVGSHNEQFKSWTVPLIWAPSVCSYN